MITSPIASIIVPAYNAADTLPNCLDSLLNQTTTVPYEIIVVNDDSADSTLTIVQTYANQHENIRVVSEGRLGKSGTRNRGAQMARAKIILFTDSDCVPALDWIETMLKPFADPDVIGIKGTYRCEQRHPVARFVQLEHEEKYEQMAHYETIDFIDTYCAGYRRDVFLAAGGFDMQLTFSYVEDQELSFRLARDGHKMMFVPEAHVTHQHPTSIWGYAKRKYKIAFWKALIVQRHKAQRENDSRTPQTLKLQMGLALLALPLLPFAFIFKIARWALLLLGVAFDVTAVPFFLFALKRDKAAALTSLIMLPVRAFGLAIGYVAGVLHWRGERLKTFLANEPAVIDADVV